MEVYLHMNIKQSNKFGLATFPSLFFIGKLNKFKKIILFYAICLEHMRNENIWAFAGCCTNKFTPRIFYHLTNVINICDEAQNSSSTYSDWVCLLDSIIELSWAIWMLHWEIFIVMRTKFRTSKAFFSSLYWIFFD